MASALTVLFFGCWLAGRSRVLGEGSYPKPSISVSPSGVIPVGGNVTIWCWHQHLGMTFLLYKAGVGNYLNYTDPAGSEAEFPITSARREHGGSYTCCYANISEEVYSEPSNPVQIIVADPSLPRPSISLSPTGVTAPEVNVTIRCQGQRRDVRFFLHKAGDLNPPRQMDPAGDGAEFRIPTVGRQHGGNYSCSYRPQSEPFVSSQPSDPVQLVVAGGTDPIQPGAAPNPISPVSAGRGGTVPTQSGAETKPTTLSSAGPGGLESPTSAPPGLISHFIAGVSAAAAVLLLLLMAFVCFRKARARKGAAPRPSSTSPAGVLKAPAQQDPVYTSIDEGKKPQTLPQEPDPGADRLTYAELDRQVLQAKRGGPAPAPEPAQPSVYAVINVSRGAPQ